MNKATGTAVKVEKEKTRFRDVLKYKMVLLKSSILGVFIGAVPGTGAAISSFLAYNEASGPPSIPRNTGTVPRSGCGLRVGQQRRYGRHPDPPC
mgnify:CR=1 FL=1